MAKTYEAGKEYKFLLRLEDPKNASDAQRNRFYYDIEIKGVRKPISSRIHHRETSENGHIRLYFTSQPEHANKTITLIAYNSEQELRKEIKIGSNTPVTGPHSLHDTLDDAAIDFGRYYNGRSILEKREYGSRLYAINEDNGMKYSYVEALPGSGGGTFIPDVNSLPDKAINAGDVHTHGNDEKEIIPEETDADNEPSYQDIESTVESGLPGYVITPSGTVQRIDPNTRVVAIISTDVPSDPNTPSDKRKNRINPTIEPYESN